MNANIHANACQVILGTLPKDSPLRRCWDARMLIDGGVSDVGFFVAVHTPQYAPRYEVFTATGVYPHDSMKLRKWRVNATDTKQQRADTRLRFKLIRRVAKQRGWVQAEQEDKT